MATSPPKAITMAITREGDMVVVSIVGRSEIPKIVRFVVDVDGRSTTRNLSRSRVGPDAKTLSVVRFADVPPWQVTLEVDEAGAAPYVESASDATFH